jgi:hypothetical protein
LVSLPVRIRAANNSGQGREPEFGSSNHYHDRPASLSNILLRRMSCGMLKLRPELEDQMEKLILG